MEHPAQGCGKTNVSLTLYFVVSDHKPRVLPGTFQSLPCGRTFDPPSMSPKCLRIALCHECAQRAGFLPLN